MGKSLMDNDKEKNNNGIIVLTQKVKPEEEKKTASDASTQPVSTDDLTRFDEKDNNLTNLVKDVVKDFPKDKAVTSGPSKISMERVEAALERVVTKLYAKKIEAMVMDTIEKTVQREIDKIKRIMKETAEKGPS